jgi:hypothetical protein
MGTAKTIKCTHRHLGHPQCAGYTVLPPAAARAFGWMFFGEVAFCPCHSEIVKWARRCDAEVVELTSADIVEVL